MWLVLPRNRIREGDNNYIIKHKVVAWLLLVYMDEQKHSKKVMR